MSVLDGVLVVEAATLLAGPMAGGLLGDFGARVIKVELPGRGDPLRDHAPFDQGISLYSKVTNRNKESMTLDLHDERDRAVLRHLLDRADVFITNFRPSTLAAWGLGYEALEPANPRLVMLQVSGFGASGPYRDKPGFARIAEAFAGLTYITGYPDTPPTFSGYPVADGLGAVYGAFGILLALLERERSGRGQLVDLPLYAPILRMMEHLVIGFRELGLVPERQGSLNPVVAPNNIYRSRDGVWVILPASTQTMFERLAHAIGRPDWVDDPRFATNRGRLEQRTELEREIATWIADRGFAEVAAQLTAYDVAWMKVNTIADLCEDPHVVARGDIIDVPDAELGRRLAMQGVVPRLSRTPGTVHRAGPALGEHQEILLREFTGRDHAQAHPPLSSATSPDGEAPE